MLLERPIEFKERMEQHPHYRTWVYEDFSQDNHDMVLEEEPRVVMDYRRLKSENAAQIAAARKAMQATRTTNKVMQRLVARFFTSREKLHEYGIYCLRKWRQVTVADTHARQKKAEDDRRKTLERMGVHMANFMIKSAARNYGSVQCEVDLYRLTDPTYFLLSVTNLKSPSENDRVTLRISKLPDGLDENETNKKKIKSVITRKLNIVWMPRD